MTADTLKLLGSELRRARLSRPGTVTQSVVGLAAGVSRKTVCAYEAGLVEPPALVLLRLAAALELDLNRLARLVTRADRPRRRAA